MVIYRIINLNKFFGGKTVTSNTGTSRMGTSKNEKMGTSKMGTSKIIPQFRSCCWEPSEELDNTVPAA